jgi:hypothetical protein
MDKSSSNIRTSLSVMTLGNSQCRIIVVITVALVGRQDGKLCHRNRTTDGNNASFTNPSNHESSEEALGSAYTAVTEGDSLQFPRRRSETDQQQPLLEIATPTSQRHREHLAA